MTKSLNITFQSKVKKSDNFNLINVYNEFDFDNKDRFDEASFYSFVTNVRISKFVAYETRIKID